MKMHVVDDPQADCPRCIEVTVATVNDVEVGRKFAIETGATYVFDKGYCHFGGWQRINDRGAFFITWAKVNTGLRMTRRRPLRERRGDSLRIIDDAEVRLVSKGDVRLPMEMRRIRLKRDNGGSLTLITNDVVRSDDRNRPVVQGPSAFSCDF